MSLKALTKIPYGNCRIISMSVEGETAEVQFTPDPNGGPECLWFCFRLLETKPEEASAVKKVRLVWKHFQNALGAGDPNNCRPACRHGEKEWGRLKPGRLQTAADGQIEVSWELEYPTPEIEIAFCYPYGMVEVKQFLAKTKGQWKDDSIGLSQQGRPMLRLCNDYSAEGAKRPGVYLIARQHSGETPGSLALDGVLYELSRVPNSPLVAWCVPLANIDGIMWGDYGKDNFPYDLNRAWGVPAMRHEVLAMQRDVERWKSRCRPVLAIDFHAPGACEAEGIYCFLPNPEKHKEMHDKAAKHANVLEQALGKEYAAANFKRVPTYPSRWNTPSAVDYFCGLGICALTIEVPYALAGQNLLTRKHYREAGKKIADAILRTAK